MSNEETAVPRLVAIDRRQLILRTVDVEKLVEQEHCVRSIWELVGRLDLRLYYAQIAAVEGSAGREHTDPQLLISLWLYAYSRGISSARELARQCEYEPGCQWLCGLQAISHRTLSGFRAGGRVLIAKNDSGCRSHAGFWVRSLTLKRRPGGRGGRGWNGGVLRRLQMRKEEIGLIRSVWQWWVEWDKQPRELHG